MEIKRRFQDVVLEEKIFDNSNYQICATIVSISSKYKKLDENGNRVYQDYLKLFQVIKDVADKKDKRGVVIGYALSVDSPIIPAFEENVNIYEGYVIYYFREEAFPKIEMLPYKLRTIFD